jgi:hypothetical protein
MPSLGFAEITTLLKGRSRLEVCAICIEASRRWQRDAPGQRIA